MWITDGTVGRLGNDDGGCVSYESVGKMGRLNGARGRVSDVGINRVDALESRRSWVMV
jgi:hypothetical protein